MKQSCCGSPREGDDNTLVLILQTARMRVKKGQKIIVRRSVNLGSWSPSHSFHAPYQLSQQASHFFSKKTFKLDPVTASLSSISEQHLNSNLKNHSHVVAAIRLAFRLAGLFQGP